MMMNRRNFIASLSLLPAALAAAAENSMPTNKNVKWALSSALWNYQPTAPFTGILDVMKDTGFIGVRVTSFPQILERYWMTQAQMLDEVTKRGLHVVTISWNFRRASGGPGEPAEGAGQRADCDEVSRGFWRESPGGVFAQSRPAGSGYAGGL